MNERPLLLIVEDDEALRGRLARAFESRGFEVALAATGAEADAALARETPEFVVLDLRMPDASGLDLISRFVQADPATRIVVLTGYGSIATAVEAVRRGAAHYLTKPADADDILAALTGEAKSEAAVPLRPMSLDQVEWEHINRVLLDCGDNISEAARVLGLHRRSLQRKLSKYPVAALTACVNLPHRPRAGGVTSSTVIMLCRARLVCLALLCVASPVFAAAAGGLKGVVHDPQHRPVAGVAVTLKAVRADWTQTATTDASGEFQFAPVPVGDYTVSVAQPGFEAPPQLVTIVSGASPEMHFQLQIAAVKESASVTASSESARPMTPTPTTLVTRDDVAGTPGADLTNSLRIVTSFVPGAYIAHDQLHVRGGHQVSWLIDGVPVPNTNIASNVGPQVDPKDIDYMEIQRGSYDAAYGDRTYGVFNVVPRTGFERNKEAELVATVGSSWQTNDQISVGDHTSRLAYYTSVTFNHSDLGLETPVTGITHDGQSGLGGFGSVIFNADARNQLRVVTSVRHDQYQIPIGPDELAAGMDDNERETDALVNMSWIHTFSPTALLTVSPFYHYNSADYLGGPADFPISTTVLRSSQYAGAQATFNADRGRHQVQAGFYGYYQHDNQMVGLTFNDGSGAGFTDGETPSGTLAAVFVQDAIAVASWLTLTAGVRQTHFSGGVTEDATSPRAGFALRVPRGGWAVRGFYGRFYQGPPLITGSGPLEAFVTAQDLAFVPLHGERDEEYQIGVTVPIRGWMVDGDRFQTSATNYFDHNNVGNSNVFFPVTIDGALIRGWELTVRSPRSWRHAQVHLAYSHQTASGIGGISGGLTDFSPPPEGSFPLDHDQRNTLSVGADAHWARGWFGGATVSYGSGFPSDTGWLPAHTTIDLSCGRQFSKNVSVSGSVLNLTNERVLIDNSLTFGGTHYNYPREIYVQFRYRFRY